MIFPKSFPTGGLSLKVEPTYLPDNTLMNATLPAVATITLDPLYLKGFEWVVSPGQEIQEEMLLARNLEKGLFLHSSIPGLLLDIRDLKLPDGRPTQGAVIRLQGSFSRTGKVKEPIDWRGQKPQGLWSHLLEMGIPLLSSTMEEPHILKGKAPTVKKLVINGLPPEPYIVTGQALLTHLREAVLEGIGILQKIFDPETTLLVLETGLEPLMEGWGSEKKPGNLKRVEPVFLASRYPQSHSVLLLQTLFGLNPKPGASALGDFQTLFLDVETVYHVYEAICLKKPMTEKFVTMAGHCLEVPKILKVRIGTPLNSLVEDCGGLKEIPSLVMLGGPFTGATTHDLGFAIQSRTSVVLFLSKSEVHHSPEQDCIRCGLCINSCPAGIQPVQIYKSLLAGLEDQALQEGLNSCLECGLCSFVCPSRIPLSDKFKQTKALLKESNHE